ncbi:MAG TPA: RDD family protein [Candidatus Omnitrophota bacterium]|nr:RDD family protein [Candidatus Omnitrophota bacterium]
MTPEMNKEGIVGGPQIPALASKGKRFAAGIIDLIIIPIILGIVAGLLLLAANDAIRNTVLILVNIGWMLFRDTVFSPGRKMVGLKLVSLSGTEKPSLGQAFIRNVLLIIPFVLVIGYLVEIVALLAKGERIADGWAKTRVTEAA